MSAPSGPSAAVSVGRPRSEEREQAILDAALELIVELGYERLSMDALAERARASKATIYRHWSGKAEVVAEAVRCRQCHQLSVPDTGTLRNDLRAMLGEVCAGMADDSGTLVASVLWATRSDPVLASLMRAQATEGKEVVVRAIVERAIGRGELQATVDPRPVTEIFSAMVFTRLLITGEPLDDEFIDNLVDGVLLPVLTAGAPGSARPPSRSHIESETP